MKPEDEELLFKDLSGRLPYNVYINDRGTPHRLVNICWDGIKFVVNCSPFGTGHGRIGTPLFDGDICYIKPYLRPMSSMTEEERKIQKGYIYHFSKNSLPDYEGDFVFEDEAHEYIDWLNKNMFDYRGLIPKDLALSTEIYNPYVED